MYGVAAMETTLESCERESHTTPQMLLQLLTIGRIAIEKSRKATVGLSVALLFAFPIFLPFQCKFKGWKILELVLITGSVGPHEPPMPEPRGSAALLVDIPEPVSD